MSNLFLDFEVVFQVAPHLIILIFLQLLLIIIGAFEDKKFGKYLKNLNSLFNFILKKNLKCIN